MEEKILNSKKNGMTVLLLSIAIYILAIIGAIVGGIMMDDGKNPALFIISLIFLSVTWLLWPGLKVLKPQEALVLTLFGKYIGTIKRKVITLLPFNLFLERGYAAQVHTSIPSAVNTKVTIAENPMEYIMDSSPSTLLKASKVISFGQK